VGYPLRGPLTTTNILVVLNDNEATARDQRLGIDAALGAHPLTRPTAVDDEVLDEIKAGGRARPPWTTSPSSCP
jgi:hypothetical protein